MRQRYRFAIMAGGLLCLLLPFFTRDSSAAIQGRGLREREPQKVSPREKEEIPKDRRQEGKKEERSVPAGKSKKQGPVAGEMEVRMYWFGHGFVYLKSHSGIRIAVDPFRPDSTGYETPPRLPADVVLMSSELPECAGRELLSGLPRVFRSITAIGMNEANGIRFYGVRSYRDSQKTMARIPNQNTIFTFTLDEMDFCFLGNLGHRLEKRTRRKIGRVEILFIPFGNKELRAEDIWHTCEDLQAKWIIPIAYGTDKSWKLENLRRLEEVDLSGRQVKQMEDSSFIFRKSELPDTPTILLLKSP